MLGKKDTLEGARSKSGGETEDKMSASKRPPRVKSPQDSQMDSGFMSGSNLLSSTSLYSEDLENKGMGLPSESTSDEGATKSSNMYTSETLLDSGIDLSEGIRSLNISSASPTAVTTTHTTSPEGEPQRRPDDPPTENRSKLAHLGLSPVHISILKEIFKKDSDGDTQLHIAVIRGFVEVVWHITRLLPHQALLDIPNNNGRTALHLAVASGDACLARHLIVCGASPVAKNKRGETPLHIACRYGDPTMVSGLTSQVTVFEVVAARLSYPPNHTPGLLAADLSNYDGQTCIHVATQHGHKQILQNLTWYGADINAKEGRCGRTALHFAVEARNLDLIRFLVDSCRAALSIHNYAGLTPYQLAVANDAQEVIALLEELGAKKDPLPNSFFVDEDLDYEEESNNLESNGEPWVIDDLLIGGVPQVPLQYTNPIPVSSHSPLNADQFL